MTAVVEEVAPADWPALAAGFADHTYEQDIAYVAMGARRVGARVRALAVRRGGALIGAGCLRVKVVPGLGRGIAYLAAGPLMGQGPEEEAPDRAVAVLGALADRLVRHEGHLLRLRLPATGQGTDAAALAGLGFEPTGRTHAYRTVLVDLSRDPAALRAGLHAKWRYELRRAEAADLEIVTGRDRDFVDRFLALYRAMREFKSFEEGHDPAFLAGMTGTSFDFEVRVARHQGVDVGGHVAVFAPACATYLFGATTGAGRDLRAGYALSWHAMLAARARGVRWYDLGGVDKATNAPGYTFKIPHRRARGGRPRALRGGDPARRTAPARDRGRPRRAAEQDEAQSRTRRKGHLPRLKKSKD